MTDVGARLAARGKRSDWGGLYFDEKDGATGSVTEAEAQLLYVLVRTVKPEVVAEIGTSFGYSALHLAQGLKDNGCGHLWTAEVDEPRRKAATANIVEAGLSELVTFCDKLPKLEHIDLAFLDAGHDEAALRDYLAQVEGAPLIIVHDAMWCDHVRLAIKGTLRSMVMLPTDSFQKMALVS